jgi:TM2 domain-containing membrane protein YozV
MAETIKCPDCGGTKCTAVAPNQYTCRYCGASFTVDAPEAPQQPQPQAAPQQPQVVIVQQPQPAPQPQQPYQPQIVGTRTKGVAALLAFFLGAIGGHYFYLGKTGTGVVMLLFCWTFIPSIIAIIDFIRFLCMSKAEFDYLYNRY